MTSIFTEEYEKSFSGLMQLSSRVRSFAQSLPSKLSAMEEKYLQENFSLYQETDRKYLYYYREAFTYKYYLSVMHLEQLWALGHLGQFSPTLFDLLSNIYDQHQVSEDKILLPSFVVEGFIVQGNSFLDFYMLYIYSILKIQKKRLDKGDWFITTLGTVSQDPFKGKAEKVKDYFANEVYNKGSDSKNWGYILAHLRNSIVHRDENRPDFASGESLVNMVLKKNGTNVDRRMPAIDYFQNIQNSMFYLVTGLAAQIYDLEWKPGPYKPGTW